MKLYHYAIIFIVIALVLYGIADMKVNQLTVISMEVERLDEVIEKAVDDGVSHLVELEGIEQISLNKDRSVEHFLKSMYAGFNVTDHPEQQEKINGYIPAIAVTAVDGFYIQYSDSFTGEDGYTYLSKRWSEKIPYSYEDDDFVYRFHLNDILTLYDKNGLLDETREQNVFTLNYKELSSSSVYDKFRGVRQGSFLLNEEQFHLIRKEQIIRIIERTMEIAINHHNMIARERGISYQFTLPTVDQSERVRSIETPGMIVMFQGYPIKDQLYTYNRMVVAGAKVSKKDVYYLEQKDWYYRYHLQDCEELKKDGIYDLDHPYYSVYDCVKEGAFACSICNQERGVAR